MEALIALGGVFLAAAVAVAPVAALALLLNLRDRRRARLLAVIADVIGAPELRGRVGLEVRCGMLSPGGRVAVHLVASSGEEILDVLSRLSRHLSRRVRLSVDSRLGQDQPTSLWVEARRGGSGSSAGGGSGGGVGDPTQREGREMERTIFDLLFATMFGVVVFFLPLGLRLWKDRANDRALALRAEIHHTVCTALGGESLVSIQVVPGAPWRRGRVELSVPHDWEWLVEAVLNRVVERTPANYDVAVRLTGRRVPGAAPCAPALKAAA